MPIVTVALSEVPAKPNFLSLDETWKELGRICNHIVDDNTSDHYSVALRSRQLIGIKALIELIEEYHEEIL